MKKLSFCKEDRIILGGLAVISACLIFFASVLLFVATTDYNDGEIEERVYCENVLNRVWPDYKKIYGEICGKYENGQAR